MSNGYRPGVREVRPGETPPTCWDCLACGIGEACYCTSPTRPEAWCEALQELGYVEGAGYTCSLEAGHDGEHEAWALPSGSTYGARAELLATW